MRSVEEIRSSIKDLIKKAENEELLKLQTSGDENTDIQLSTESDLSEEIMEQINLEVTEFEKAFKKQGAEGLIAKSISDALKPVLDEWLKTNLPIIVSEVIDEKIREITKKT